MPLQINQRLAVKTLTDLEPNSNKVVLAGTNAQELKGSDSLTFDGSTFSVTGTVATTSFTLGGTAITATGAELNYTDGVSGNIQTQLDGKSPTAGNASLVTVGTIGTGVWQGTAIANAYVADLPASKITSGTFADARIAASNVTQHQGSIVGVGALDSGSITSGFGSIDIGSSNLTVGDITATGGDLTLGTASDANNTSIQPATESGADVAGKNLVVSGGLGTGNAVPGNVEVKIGVPQGSGSNAQTAATAIKCTQFGTSVFYGGTANLANDTGVGEIVLFGTEDNTETLSAGRLCYLDAQGVWKYADASAVATGSNLLAIALGSSVSDGMLIRGYFKLNSYIEGSFAKGSPCYISESASEIDFTAPSAQNEVVRIVGYGTDTTNVILFSPSPTYIKIA